MAVLVSCQLGGCSTFSIPPEQLAEVSVGGTWKGISKVTPCFPATVASGRCNAENSITLSLTGENSQIKGSYKCEIGTQVCRNANIATSGVVNGTMLKEGRVSLRIFFPGDGSSCYFNGTFSPAEGGGAFVCYQGGALVEEGTWQVARESARD